MYNTIIDITEEMETGYGEPVSASLAKTFCRVTSTNDNIDELFELWITAARQLIEKATGLSLVPKAIECQLQNPQGNIELPGGPVNDEPVFTDRDGNTLDIQTNGFIPGFVSISNEVNTDFTSGSGGVNPKTIGRIDASYTAGYAECPAWAKNAILNQVNYWWENRGADSQEAGLCANVNAAILPYSRIPMIF